MTSYEQILYDVAEGVATVTLNRPGKLNAWTGQMAKEIQAAMAEQELVGHNRWHPEIPAVVSVNPGDVFRIECKDWPHGQIKNNDSPADIRDMELSIVHVLSGPLHVNGAKPGDILVVDLLDSGCFPGEEWGFTGIFARKVAFQATVEAGGSDQAGPQEGSGPSGWVR